MGVHFFVFRRTQLRRRRQNIKSKIVQPAVTPLTIFGLFAVTAIAGLLCLRSAEPMVHSCVAGACIARFVYGFSRGCLRTGGGSLVRGGIRRWTVAAAEMSSLASFSADYFGISSSAPGGFLPASLGQHATADDSNVEFRLRELIGAEQEAGHGHGSAGARRRLAGFDASN